MPLTLSLNKSIIDEFDEELKGEFEYQFPIKTYDQDFISTYQKLLIIDTAGMGKSTISKKLFLSAIEENKGIPVFIELRRLNSNHSILNEIYKELKLINEEVDEQFILDLILLFRPIRHCKLYH